LWSPKNREIKFYRMANHKSSLKRIRQNESRKDLNKYVAKTTRNAVKKFRDTSDKKEAVAALPTVASMLDKLAKKHVIHKNKASNLKSKLARQANKIA
jgi:small subunit ribosomal protein S20